jgi:hypothetical protein
VPAAQRRLLALTVTLSSGSAHNMTAVARAALRASLFDAMKDNYGHSNTGYATRRFRSKTGMLRNCSGGGKPYLVVQSSATVFPCASGEREADLIVSVSLVFGFAFFGAPAFAIWRPIRE